MEEELISLESRDFPTPYLILNGLYNCKTVRKMKGELGEVYKIIAEKEEEIKRLEKSRKRHRQSEDYSGFGGRKRTRLSKEGKEEVKDVLEKKTEEIIPAECWELVFQNLNADDLMSCRQVCKTFHKILDLKQLKIKWKFQLVLPIIFKELNDRGRRTWKNFHNLRLVCQSWRQSVDKYVSEFHGPQFFSLLSRHFPLATSFFSVEKIVEFHQTFEECNGNPFPAKTVFISNGRGCLEEQDEEEDEDEDYEDAVIRTQDAYIQKVTDFMERFGMNIHKLELYFCLRFYGTDYLFMCKLIKRITPHLPNLHTFRISGFNYEQNLDQRVRDDPRRMSTWIEENALSDLPKLQALQILGLNEIAENYLVEKYAPQLIHFQRKHDFEEDIVHQPQFQLFQNLNKLQLEFVGDEGTLKPLRFLQSPLKLMRLVLSGGEGLTWNMDKALLDIRHLPIQSLEIEAYANVNFVECLPPEEYFNESIQTLTFHITYFEDTEGEDYVGEISFNFLQALTKLENLDLKFELAGGTITHPEDLLEVVKLNEYMMAEEETLYHSNVWEKVPSLKTLKAERESEDGYFKSTYTREEYERFMNNAE